MRSDSIATGPGRWSPSTHSGRPSGSGSAPDRWSLDVSDVASIATSHEWIDRYREETLQQARRRALHYATSWARRAEQLDSSLAPGAAARAERAALLWAVRAGLTEPATEAIRAVEVQTGAEDPDEPR